MYQQLPTLLTSIAALVLVSACGGPDVSGNGVAVDDFSNKLEVTQSYSAGVGALDVFEFSIERTNIPELWGLDLTSLPLASSAEIMSSAAAGDIDIAISSDAPVSGAIDKGFDFVSIAQHAAWFQGVAVQPDRGMESLADLVGQKVGVHEGATTPVYLRVLLKEEGIDPSSIEWVNTPIVEQMSAMKSGNVDAVMSWSPTYSQLLAEGFESVYQDAVGVGMPFPGETVVVKRDMLENRRTTVIRYLAAQATAMVWAAQNEDLVSSWFLEKYPIDANTLASLLAEDPLWVAAKDGDIDTLLSPIPQDHIRQMNETARELIPGTDLDYADQTDDTVIPEAEELLDEHLEKLLAQVEVDE